MISYLKGAVESKSEKHVELDSKRVASFTFRASRMHHPRGMEQPARAFIIPEHKLQGTVRCIFWIKRRLERVHSIQRHGNVP